MFSSRSRLLLLLTAVVTASPASAQAPLGDTSACMTPGTPAIRANVTGLKDRIGELKLELYPANEQDFLKDDRDLIREGKIFRRVRVPTPKSGAVSLCIRVPAPGRYALLFTHNRDGHNKFDFWKDGVGFSGSGRIGRTRPKLAEATIEVGRGVTVTNIRAQYLRGLSGFGPVGS